jgi:hypothetical protein
MRGELDSRRMDSRIKGRQALEKTLRLLIIRLNRYGEHRARSARDARWAAGAIATLRALLDEQDSDAAAALGEIHEQL